MSHEGAECDMFNLGSSYFHVALTTVRHLLSVAEFYIEPMLPLVGDVDVMHHRSTQLAVPRGHPPPTQIPAEFSDYVQVSRAAR